MEQEWASGAGHTLEAVNVVYILPREILCLEARGDGGALGVVGCDNAELEVPIIVLHYIYYRMNFFCVLDMRDYVSSNIFS